MYKLRKIYNEIKINSDIPKRIIDISLNTNWRNQNIEKKSPTYKFYEDNGWFQTKDFEIVRTLQLKEPRIEKDVKKFYNIMINWMLKNLTPNKINELYQIIKKESKDLNANNK